MIVLQSTLFITVPAQNTSRVVGCLTCSFLSPFPPNFTMQTVLEQTMNHIFNSLEKLFGADDSTKNNKMDADNLQSTKRKAQNSTQRRRLSPIDASSKINGGE